MDRLLSDGKLTRILRRYDVFEDASRGKGGHRLLVRVVEGQRLRVPVQFHGRNYEYGPRIVGSVRRGLKLTPVDGVTDADFYG